MSNIKRPLWRWLAVIIALGFGALTIKAGGSVLFIDGEARQAAGHYVGFVLWFNFLAGFAYIAAGAGLWFETKWATPLAIVIAVATVLVFAAFGIHILIGGEYEMRTVVAMSLRSTIWLAIAAAAYFLGNRAAHEYSLLLCKLEINMKTCKLSWSISGLLLIVVVLMAYKFILSGSVAPSNDGRQAILLEEPERDLVLAEMRMFLTSVQSITKGVGEKDMAQVVKAARQVGAQAQQAVPGSLVGKLPLVFKQLGFDTHKKFDLLALDAEALGDPQHALQQLAELMNNCVACHATYKINAKLSQ